LVDWKLRKWIIQFSGMKKREKVMTRISLKNSGEHVGDFYIAGGREDRL
jgi:hypothetical protein